MSVLLLGQLARYGFPHPRYLDSTGNLNTRNSTGVDDLSSGNISRLHRPTLTTMMNAIAYGIFDSSAAIRTFLRGAVGVNLFVIDTALEAHPRQDLVHELPQTSIECVFTQHPFRHDAKVKVYVLRTGCANGKDDLGLVTKLVGQLELPVKATCCYLLMHPSNPSNQLGAVIRAPLLILQSALQQFKLAVQLTKKAWALYLQAVGSGQEVLKPYVNADTLLIGNSIRHIDIGLNA